MLIAFNITKQVILKPRVILGDNFCSLSQLFFSHYRGFPKIDQSGIDTGIVLEQKNQQKVPSNRD